MIALVDYGAGNLRSVELALERLGVPSRRAASPAGLEGASGIVLPGVGAAAPAMRALEDAGLAAALRRTELPFLGICLGMQLLVEVSEEGGEETACLGVLPGRTRAFPDGVRVPHTGWNALEPARDDPLLEGVPAGTHVFFNHSFRVECPEEAVVATATHGRPFPAVLRAGSRAGVQFHPEKSGPAGLRVLTGFAAACGEPARAGADVGSDDGCTPRAARTRQGGEPC